MLQWLRVISWNLIVWVLPLTIEQLFVCIQQTQRQKHQEPKTEAAKWNQTSDQFIIDITKKHVTIFWFHMNASDIYDIHDHKET